MPQNTSLEVVGRIDAWWSIAKDDVLTDPFGPMAKAGLFQIGLPGAGAVLDSYRAIAMAEQAIAAKTGLLGLASAFAARQMTARFFIAGFAERIPARDMAAAHRGRPGLRGDRDLRARRRSPSQASADLGRTPWRRVRHSRPQGLGHQWPGRGCVSGAGGDRGRGWTQAIRPVSGPEGNARPQDKTDAGAGYAGAVLALRTGIRRMRGAQRRRGSETCADAYPADGAAVSRCRGHRRHRQRFGAAELAAGEIRRPHRALGRECPAARPHRRPGVAGARGEPTRGGGARRRRSRKFRRG